MTEEKLRAWIQASSPPFFVATMIPIVIGWTMARDGHPFLFLLVLLGAFLVHFATNIVNDYFDCLEGADAGPSIGGSRVIQEGKLNPRQILCSFILSYTLAGFPLCLKHYVKTASALQVLVYQRCEIILWRHISHGHFFGQVLSS